jgi:paraquat-inducible protein B
VSARTSHFRLGLFILAATALGVAFVVALGVGNLFQKKTYLETYFDTSVQGLDIGSAVKYRGVTVGRISEITFTHARYEQDQAMSTRRRYVMVIATVQPELLGLEHGIRKGALQAEIERGLRVRSTPWGITGTNYLELDYVDPQHNPPVPITWEPRHLYIPSAPGPVAQITNAAEDLARRLQVLDVEGLVDSLTRLARVATATLERAPVDELSKSTGALVGELRETNRRVQVLLASADLPALSRDAAGAARRLRALAESDELQRSLAELAQALHGLNRLAGGRDGDVAATLDNLRRMSENLRDLSESLKEYPSQLIRAAPPPRVERR